MRGLRSGMSRMLTTLRYPDDGSLTAAEGHTSSPVELIWPHLKRSLTNLAKRDLSQLIALVATRSKRMQCLPGRSMDS
jgi:hypothetical protein